MPTARDLLAAKNSAVAYTCAPGDRLAEACRVLRDRGVGCLVVVEGGAVVGVLGEREVARAVADGADPSALAVRDAMRREPATVTLDTPCERVEALLRGRRLHHLPVVGERGLLGVVSLGDVARFYAARSRTWRGPPPEERASV